MNTTQENHAISIRAAIQENGQRGESAMLALAESFGDDALRPIVADLTAAEIVEVAAQYDITKPSLLHGLIEPQQLPDAFDRFGKRWAYADQKAMEGLLHGRRDELADFLCPMILHSDDPHRVEAMWLAFAEHPMAGEALTFLGLERAHLHELLAHPNQTTAEKQGFEELYCLAAKFSPEIWGEVKSTHCDLSAFDKTIEFATEFCNSFHTDEEEPANGTPAPLEDVFLDF